MSKYLQFFFMTQKLIPCALTLAYIVSSKINLQNSVLGASLLTSQHVSTKTCFYQTQLQGPVSQLKLSVQTFLRTNISHKDPGVLEAGHLPPYLCVCSVMFYFKLSIYFNVVFKSGQENAALDWT